MRSRTLVFVAAGFVVLGISARSAGAQTACTTFSFSPSTESELRFSSGRGGSYVRISAPPDCPYTVVSSAPFLTPQIFSDVGPAYLFFSVAANFTSRARSAEFRMADQRITITQGRGVPIVDFNRDGQFDLLWHNRNDGRLSTWLMNGTRMVAGPSFIPDRVPDTSWELAGSADLDGDGDPDLVWQNNVDGRVAAWLMSGLQLVRGELLSILQVADRDWRIQAVSDLNGDGRADLFWQHLTAGLVAVWFMDGPTVLDASLIQGPVLTDLRWRLVGARGSDTAAHELVWQHEDGRLAVWEVLGKQVRSAALTGSRVSDPNWTLRALGDLDRDGVTDYIWQHALDGRLSAWTARSGSPDLGVVPDLNWRLVGPR
jgi:hypothetical protein